ncbi:MAG: hypothetical protein VYA86_00155 [Candidatus Thermoplasmatota archaeon]|nr:hypothetical protein [Candidatus Thermoplasmatota archaeon]
MSVMDDDDEVDVFEELGVNAPVAGAPVSDPLEAFLEDEDETEEDANDLGTEIVEIQVDEEDGDDEDPFVALGVAGPVVALATDDTDDPLSALMDDEEEDEEEEDVTESSAPESERNTSSIDAYRMVLETVWVDGFLDPGEVCLLAGRRKELGITFEEHLRLVREMLG